MELAKNLELHGFWKDIIAFPPNHNRELFDSDFLFFFPKKKTEPADLWFSNNLKSGNGDH